MDQHGCAKNQTDGELIVGYLSKIGFELTQNPDEAAFIIVNSCGFIESAKKESIDAVYSIHNNYPDAKIILTGCLAQRYAETLAESMPELDGVFGNGDLSKIGEFMKSLSKDSSAHPFQTFPQTGVCSGDRPVLFNYPASAYVKITEGCSNHCSFCAIPLIRGELRSRPQKEIIEEIQKLVKDGIYEINLIGQDLAAYGSEPGFEGNLYSLLKMISEIPGDFIVRLLYIHPDHFNSDILDVMKKDSRFLHYFDIPFQSGDDQIIKKMNRTGSRKLYVSLVENIRQLLPDCALRTTFLTGFPGETDANASNTLDFLNDIRPSWSGCFPYSREEDTPAYNFKGKVSSKTAQKRASILEERQAQITAEYLGSFVGKTVSVLIEEVIESPEDDLSGEGLAIGRAWFQAPDVDGSVVVRYDADDENQKKAIQPGNVVNVKILASTGVDLDGRFESLLREFPKKSEHKFIF
ncbi:MAG: 30S ribosomal protein S12 methylthiotransferase RimO [Treponema sp.]|nr:30S ribosomal protein S12 methylthiotransferase RimO [Treponema sp.]